MALDTRWKNPQGKDPEQLWRWAQDLITELRKGEFFSTQIGSGITNAQLAEMAAWTIKARNNSAAGAPQDVARGDLTAATNPVNAHELLGFLSTNELRRFTTGNLGGLQLLNSNTVTNQSTLPIVLTSYTSYRALKLLLTTFVPATDDVELWLRFSTNGGSSYDATGYSWTGTGSRDGSASTFASSSSAANQISLTGLTGASENVSNVAAEGGITTEVTLADQSNTGIWQRAHWLSRWYSANDQSFHISGTGARETAQDTDAIEIRFESGNISSGKWALYGYA